MLSSDPALLLEWLEALAFHGALPQPPSRHSPVLAPAGTLTPQTPYFLTDSATHHQQQYLQQQEQHKSQEGAPEVSFSSRPQAYSTSPLHPCDSWLHDIILTCLAHATPWQLPSLAARLAAAAAAASSPHPHPNSSPSPSSPSTSLSAALWLSLAVRATELAARCCLHITPLWNGNRIYQDLTHVADAMLTLYGLAAADLGRGGPRQDGTHVADAALTLYDLAPAAPPVRGPTRPSKGDGQTQQHADDKVPASSSPAENEGSSAAAGPEAGAKEAEEQRAWGALQAWAVAELPHQGERWLRKLGARVHKGAGRGLAQPLPREPEWPTFEQGAVLLDQAVRLGEAVRAVRLGAAGRAVRMAERGFEGMDGTDGAGPAVRLTGHAYALGEADMRPDQQQPLPLPQQQHGSPLRLGLVVNLLTVLQAQLRTPSAGVEQLRLVLGTLEQLERGQGDAWGQAPAGRGPPVGQELPDAPAAFRQALTANQETQTGGRGALLGRHGGWARTAADLYGSLLLAGGCTAGGGQSVTEAVAACADVRGGVVGLLPSLVVGQVFRGWVAHLQAPVASVVQAAVRGAYADEAVESVLQQRGKQQLQQKQQGQEAANVAERRAKERLRDMRCLERLGYPLPYTAMGTTVKPVTPAPGEPPVQPQRRVGLRAGMAAAGGSGATPQGTGRAANSAPGSINSVPSMATAANPSSSAGFTVARPYPETANLPALPGPVLHSAFPVAAGTPPVPVPEAIRHAQLGLLVSSLLSSLQPAPPHHPSTQASSPAPAPTSAGPAPFLAPPGATPRALALPGPQLRMLVSGLVSYPPSALRPEELWVCHVAERDAGVGLLLQQVEQQQEVEKTKGAAGLRLPGERKQNERNGPLHGAREAVAAQGGGCSAALSATWAAWLHEAREVQLAAANTACAAAVLASSSSSAATSNPQVAVTGTGSLPHSSPAGTAPGHRVASGSDSPPFAHVLLSSAATPAVVSRPALPPVACLELLLLRHQHAQQKHVPLPSGTGLTAVEASGEGGGARVVGGVSSVFTLTQERGRTAAAQWVLGAMWQGDWFRGDPSTLGRFGAEELLFVACLLAEMWEAQVGRE